MYGADGSGSLFDESNKEWNVAALDDLLMRINPHMPMPGVNTPYLYFGMWRATCECRNGERTAHTFQADSLYLV